MKVFCFVLSKLFKFAENTKNRPEAKANDENDEEDDEIKLKL